MYVDNQGQEQDCVGPPAHATDWLAPQKPVRDAQSCTFACDTGYVVNAQGSACELPAPGTYLDTNGDQQNCTGGLPQNAKAWVSPGPTVSITDSATCPFECKSGYVLNPSARTCTPPDNGHYANVKGVQQTCSPIQNSNWLPNNGPISDENGCPFDCSNTYTKNAGARTCDPPGSTFTPAGGSPTPCSEIRNRGAWIASQTPLTTDTCGFTCKAGYVKDATRRKCKPPALGKYGDGTDNTNLTCTAIIGDMGGFKDWVAPTGAVATADACDYTCNNGYVKDADGRACNYPTEGHYGDGSINTALTCTGISGIAGGFKAWIAPTGAVATADACGFTCKNGYVKDASGRACNYPAKGHYGDGSTNTGLRCEGHSGPFTWVENTSPITDTYSCDFTCPRGYIKQDATNLEEGQCILLNLGQYFDDKTKGVLPCTAIRGNTRGFKAWVKSDTPLFAADACDYTCNNGYVKNADGRACNYPTKGHYGDGSINTALTCTAIRGDTGGFKAWVVPTGAVTAANACGFTCKNGYVKDASGRACNYPAKGHYGDGSINTALTCTPIGDGFKDWVTPTGSVATAKACDFTCKKDYVKSASKRKCKSTRLPFKAIAIAAGYSHTCTLFESGKVKCWGYNSYGQLGLGHERNLGDESGEMGNDLDFVDLGTQADNSTKHRAQAIALGQYHTCAILKNGNLKHGKVKCWGDNTFGQLGLGTGKIANFYNTPQSVDLGPSSGTKYTAKAISVRSNHTCAILNDDSVKCWGNNDEGQLGLGPTKSADSYNTPQAVNLEDADSTQHTAQAIALGQNYTCVILKNGLLKHGRVKCWGANDEGQLGLASTKSADSYNTPQPMNLGSNTAKALAGGSYYTCIILNDDSVKCWTGKKDPQAIAVVDLGVKAGNTTKHTAQAIEIGVAHTCVILKNGSLEHGSLKCWDNQETPQEVDLGTLTGSTTKHTVKAIAGGRNSDYLHTCAILENGRVKCWGYNQYGQLGLGTNAVNPFWDSNTGNPLTGNDIPYVELGF